MRIAYLTCVFPPYPGGIGVAAQGMAAEMGRRGHEVAVLTPRQKGYRLQVTGYRLHELQPWIRFGNAALLPQVLWRLRDFDIVHVLYPFYGTAELIPWLKRRSRAKIVVHHMMDAVASGALGAFFRWHARYLMPRIFRAADRVAVLSEDYYRNSDVGKIGLKHVEVVPHGVDTEHFRPKSEMEIRNSKFEFRNNGEYPISNIQYPAILFVGGLDRAHYFKGVPVLLEACRILRVRRVQFQCQIVGDGDMRKEYERQAKDSPSRKGLSLAEFVGLIPHDELPSYYQRASVCVVPSTERIECFSIVAAEAQACGIPVIVANFPGVRVTIEGGVTGFVARPGDVADLADKIQTLLDNPQQARKMGESGRARAERMYSWRVVGDKLEHIYAGLRNQ